MHKKGQSVLEGNEKMDYIFVYTNIVGIFVKIVMKIQKPKCGCGNTQNPEGFCDGSHSKN